MRKVLISALVGLFLIGMIVSVAYADEAAVDRVGNQLYLPNDTATEAADNPIHVGQDPYC